MAERLLDERQLELRASVSAWSLVRRVALAAGALAGAFVLAGFSEQFGFVLIVVLLVVAVWARQELTWCALAGAIAGYAVVAAAPGNAIRLSALEDLHIYRPPVLVGLVYALWQTVTFVGQTLVYRCYSVGIVVIAGYIAGAGQRVKKRSVWILVTFAASFGLIAISLLPPSLTLGSLPDRNYTLATFILVTAAAVEGYLLACRNTYR